LEFLRKAEKQKNSEKKTKKSSNSKSLLKKMTRALADRVAAVRNSKEITKAFPRFITGLVLLVLIAPSSDMFYTYLDPNDKVPASVWYYQSFNWLFLCLGPYLKNFFTVIGIYMCFIHKRSPILAAVASYSLMYDVAKIIWLLLVKNHDQYNSLTPKMFWIYGFITSVFIIYIIDLLSYWLNHRVHAITSRLKGLRLIADKVEPQVLVNGFIETMDNSMKVDQLQSR
jgi:hypothetical protein